VFALKGFSHRNSHPMYGAYINHFPYVVWGAGKDMWSLQREGLVVVSLQGQGNLDIVHPLANRCPFFPEHPTTLFESFFLFYI
jgi:hypothetical protein